MSTTLHHSQSSLMRDRLLEMLRQEWVTPVSALNTVGCFSLSQRVGEFVRDGMAIQKQWVDLPSGKRVRAYRLDDPSA